MREENYENFKRFILMNYKIKKELFDLRPSLATDSLSEDAIVKYTDEAYDTLRFIIKTLKIIIRPYDRWDKFAKKIDELGQIWITKFTSCKLDLDKLRAFYNDYVTNMSPELVSTVKKSFCAYSWLNNEVQKPLAKCHTINEMLHIMHFYVMNDEANLHRLNIIDEKSTGYLDEQITLYGEVNDIARKIYDNIPGDLDIGATDIVSLGKYGKVIMMVRNLGHALTLEIDSSENDILITYFIPKICNVEKTNKLPGIDKLREDAKTFDGATGRFVTTKDKLCESLYGFLSKVPTDDDLPREDEEDFLNSIIPPKKM